MKIPPYVENKIGMKFGMLEVISFERKEYAYNRPHYFVRCQCECGTVRIMRVDHLPKAKSCGCLKPAKTPWHTTHKLQLTNPSKGE